jgi:hypothetical protein
MRNKEETYAMQIPAESLRSISGFRCDVLASRILGQEAGLEFMSCIARAEALILDKVMSSL